MRKFFIVFLTGLLALTMAGIASAAALNWEGTFVIDMVDFGKGKATGGGVATVNDSAGGVPAHLQTLRLAGSRGHVTGSSINLITDPESAGNGLAAINFEDMQGGTGTLGAISGGASSGGALTPNTMPIYGVVKICLLSTACTINLALPFTGPTPSGTAGIGIGGMLTVGGYGGIRMSLNFDPWTIKTITLVDQITTTGGSRVSIDVVQKGWAHAPVSTTTSTANISGMVQLVTPNQAQTNLPLGSNDQVGSSGLFIMHFIPEPGLLLLLGSGVVGLALLGRARMRR